MAVHSKDGYSCARSDGQYLALAVGLHRGGWGNPRDTWQPSVGRLQQTPKPEESVPAVMPAGSALLYLGKTVHGAGANVTADSWRHGLHLSFVLGWLTPEEASPICVPWQLARAFSPRVQRMLGYASPGPGDGEPPRNWLVDFVDVRKYLGVGG